MRPSNVLTLPFVSSKLSIPPSPFSPRFPITPSLPPPRTQNHSLSSLLLSTPPPPKPLQWLWQCHICNRTYPLGATRRCLDDGHYFCAGTTIKRKGPRGKKVRQRHRACASEFDYSGWKAWGDWRRHELKLRAEYEKNVRSGFSPLLSDLRTPSDRSEAEEKKSCWDHCDYPSECRWGKQFGVKSETAKPDSPTVDTAPSTPPPPPPTTFDGILQNPSSSTPETEKEDFWSTLLASVSRRKSSGSSGHSSGLSSPLALSPVMEEMEMEDVQPSQDIAMPSPAVLAPGSAEPSTASDSGEPYGPLMDIINDSLSNAPNAPEPALQMPTPNSSPLFDLGLLEDASPALSAMRSTIVAKSDAEKKSEQGKKNKKKKKGYVERLRK